MIAPQLSDLETRLLSRIQADFPLVERPFLALAGDLGSAEAEVIERVRDLLDQGLIREISPVFEVRRLGYVSTLAAAEVPPERVADVTDIISKYPEVTHSYLRDHQYNLWFTVVACGHLVKELTLASIGDRTGCRPIHNLPAVQVFKVRAVFSLADTHLDRPIPCATNRASTHQRGKHAPDALSTADWDVIEALQEGIVAAEEPFAPLADRARLSQPEFLECAQALCARGVIRRFGARLRHHRVGIEGNAMVVWDVAARQIKRVGQTLAAFPQVSHCYERPPFADFPYNLYTMVHAKTLDLIAEVVDEMAEAAGIVDYEMLRTVRELKKTTPRYRRPMGDDKRLAE